MKTQFTVDKEFIKEAYNSACPDWKAKLKNKFPEAFQRELEVGKWYKGKDKILTFFNKKPVEGDTVGYGFGQDGSWKDFYFFYDYNKYRLATKEEVETALIAEAKRRGFKEGVRFKNMRNGVIQTVKSNVYLETGYTLHVESPKEEWEEGNSNPRIFDNGKWAEIIPEPIELTLEQIAEKFNVNVEQLKIKK